MNEPLLAAAVAVTLLFAFINGLHDGGNVIATIVSSRSMEPRKAVALGALGELAGALLLGTAVARTVAARILNPELLQGLGGRDLHLLIIGAVGAAIAWNLFTWVLRLPSSSSHALIGGLLGAGWVTLGHTAIVPGEVLKTVVAPLFLAPLVGLPAGFLVFSALRTWFGQAHTGIRHFFVALQTPSVLFLAATQGSNDSQKAMGVIAMALAAAEASFPGDRSLPLWVVAGCGTALALGMWAGGWRIVKTVGYNIFRMQPAHSFSSQFAAASIIACASLLGGPVSTSQVVASSVMGVGASRRLSAVRWSLARNIMNAWIVTIPLSGLLGAGACWVLIQILVR
ncbi:MAG: inorganic phosphate transporter [bacterium]